jgi:hypothetical protein
MIIDWKHKNWALTTAGAAVISYAIYVPLSRKDPRGGSALGIVFGSAGAAIFIFECLLSLKKRFAASRRTGPVQTWLRAHIWLGLLSFPLVLMHSGFRWGNGLAAALMWVLLIVSTSGVVGVALQNYLPRQMKELVEKETIFEQIPHVVKKLREEADKCVQRVHAVEIGAEAMQSLDARYNQEIVPYLSDRPSGSSMNLFATRTAIRVYFDKLRSTTPFPAHRTLNALEGVCEERRQLAVQRTLHNRLHGWLLVHVPLSFGLLVLTAVHAVLALRY